MIFVIVDSITNYRVADLQIVRVNLLKLTTVALTFVTTTNRRYGVLRNRLLTALCILALTLELNITEDSDIFFEPHVQQEEQIVSQNQEQATYLPQEAVSRSRRGYSIVVTATAYTPDDEGCTGIAYDGRPAIPYRTIAVDPKVIPLGSRVYIPGFGWMLAHDIGGAIKGRRMDICLDTIDSAYAFGRRQVEVYVEPPATPYKLNW